MMRASVLSEQISNTDLVSAFPQDLKNVVKRTVWRLRQSRFPPKGRTPIRLRDETVHLPHRIYNDTRPLLEWLPLPSPAIWDCLMSCHHNGRERERAIRAAIASGEDFVVPFVVQLLGGYVIEIHRTVEKSLADSELDDDVYVDFASTNREFMELTHARATSYRSAYYWSIPKDQYPALRLLNRWMTGTRP